MTLEKQIVSLKFTDGQDTRSNQKLLAPAKWKTLRNCSFSADGTIKRRPGITQTQATTGLTGVAKFGPGVVYQKGSALQVNTSANTAPFGAPPIAPFAVKTASVAPPSGNCLYGGDIATGGGYDLAVWVESGTSGIVYWKSFNHNNSMAPTGAFGAIDPSGTGLCPRVVYASGKFIVAWLHFDGANYGIRVVWIDPASWSVSAVSVVRQDASIQKRQFDLCKHTDNTYAVVAYSRNDGVHTAEVALLSTTNTVSATLAVGTVAEVDPTKVNAIAAAPGSFGLNLTAVFLDTTSGAGTKKGIAGFTISQSAGAPVLGTALTQIYATGTTAQGLCGMAAVWSTTASAWHVVTDGRADFLTTGSGRAGRFTVTFTLTLSSSFLFNSRNWAVAGGYQGANVGPYVIGKPFSITQLSGAEMLIVPCCVSTNSGTGGLVNCQVCWIDALNINAGNFPFVVGAGWAGEFVDLPYRNNWGNTNPYGVCSSPSLSVGGSSGYGTLFCRSETGVLTSGRLSVATLVDETGKTTSSAQLGTCLYYGGSLLTQYDGNSVCEAGFLMSPVITQVTTAAGGVFSAGQRALCMVYEWTDSTGQRHQSAPSPTTLITTALNDKLTVLAPYVFLSNRDSTQINAVLYSTIANGKTMYRVPNGSVNITSAGGVFIGANDTTLAAQELLYSQPLQSGTILPNDSPGPGDVIGQFNNSIVYNMADHPLKFAISQTLTDGVGLRFSDFRWYSVPNEGVAVTGFVQMDEKLVVFCTSGIYVVYGQTPDATGAGGSLVEPQKIPSDVGCVERRSVLLIPPGVVFKSSKGWYLLGRDLSVKYIGGDVKAYDTNGVSSVFFMPDRQEMWVTCDVAGGYHVPRHLIWSYLAGQWSEADVRDGTTNAFVYMTGGIGNTVCSALHGYLTIDQTPQTASPDPPDAFVDSINGTALPSLYAQSAFIHVSEFEGFQRVSRMNFTGDCGGSLGVLQGTLTISVDFDDEYAADGVTIPGAYTLAVDMATFATATNNSSTSIDVRHKLARQKCKSLSFSLLVTSPSSYGGEGTIIGFEAIALEIGVKRGTNKLQAAQTVG